MAGVDGLGPGCAVACDRLGGIAAADVTIESFVAQGIFGGLVHDSICRVLSSFFGVFRPSWDILPPEDQAKPQSAAVIRSEVALDLQAHEGASDTRSPDLCKVLHIEKNGSKERNFK
jgi:hypothetical protein